MFEKGKIYELNFNYGAGRENWEKVEVIAVALPLITVKRRGTVHVVNVNSSTFVSAELKNA